MPSSPSVPVSSGQVTDLQLVVYLGGYAAGFRDVAVKTGMATDEAVNTASSIIDRIVFSEPQALDGMRVAIATLLTTVPGEYGVLRPHRTIGKVTDQQIVIYLAGYAAGGSETFTSAGHDRTQAEDRMSWIVHTIVHDKPELVDELRGAIATLLENTPSEFGVLRPDNS